jgi:pimeloyl-ACP methyl ester carboxylesterase
MQHVFAVLVKAILAAALLIVTLLLAWAFESRSLPALHRWHTVVLDSEFTACDATPQSTLRDYLDQEARLFEELREKVYQRVEDTDALIYSRYRAGGIQDPDWQQHNWNRTFELVPSHIRGGALLLHGLTDSPYSLRRIGELLYAKGFYVLGLRLPGHGTIPGALTQVHWEDWVAASRIGARHVRERIGPTQPFIIAGYSNGGALSVRYALDALTEADLPVPDRLLLFSPEIGIEPLAGIADSHEVLSFLPYFEQFKWLSAWRFTSTGSTSPTPGPATGRCAHRSSRSIHGCPDRSSICRSRTTSGSKRVTCCLKSIPAPSAPRSSKARRILRRLVLPRSMPGKMRNGLRG